MSTTVWRPLQQWLTTDILRITPGVYVEAQPTVPISELVGLLFMPVVAAAVTLVWSYFDRDRLHYRRLHEWLRVYLRYGIGVLLLGYGFRKLFLEQFGPHPAIEGLMTPVGSLNRLGMLIAFMGASPLYQAFTGGVEIVTAILLMIRRTSRLGALLAVPVTTTIVVLNLGYYFTMYTLSLLLLFMAIILAAPDLPRLWNLLVLNRPIEPSPVTPLFSHPRLNRISRALGVIYLVLVLGITAQEKATAAERYDRFPPLYGLYEVEAVERNGKPVPLLLDDRSIWRRFVVDRGYLAAPAFAAVTFADTTLAFTAAIDTVRRLLTLSTRRQRQHTSTWLYMQQDTNHLVLTGTSELRQVASINKAAEHTTRTDEGANSGSENTLRVTLRRIDGTLRLLQPQPWYR